MMFVGAVVLGSTVLSILFLPLKTYWAGVFLPAKTLMGKAVKAPELHTENSSVRSGTWAMVGVG